MADTGLLIGGAAAIGVGYFLWKQSQKPSTVTTTTVTPINNPGTVGGYSIPSDLLGAMERAYAAAGSNIAPYSQNNWITYMRGVVPASYAAWNYVYTQWIGLYATTGGGWPSNSQLTGWLSQGITNYG